MGNNKNGILFFSRSEEFGPPTLEKLKLSLKNSIVDEDIILKRLMSEGHTRFFFSEASTFDLAKERCQEFFLEELVVVDSIEVQEELKSNFDVYSKVSDKTMALAFKALALSIMEEYFISSASKVFLFESMKRLVEKNSTKEEYDNFLKAFKKSIENFLSVNDFIG